MKLKGNPEKFINLSEIGKAEKRHGRTEEGEPMENSEQQKPINEPTQIISETGTISSVTTITGIIASNGHIKIEGEVIGDIHILGDVSITGKLTGAIEGNKVELSGSKTVGDIKARGDVAIGSESSVKGDIKGQTITVDGRIEGNTEAKVGVHMAKTAVIKGAITAPTLSMISGAEFQGKVNVTK